MKQHILLIDDDKDEVLILSEAMNNAGIAHECTWAKGVIKPDIIFIDLNMPVINGIEGIRRIRNLRSMTETPLILYSNNIEQKEKAIRLGATDCLKKPDSMKELTDLLSDMMLRIAQKRNVCI